MLEVGILKLVCNYAAVHDSVSKLVLLPYEQFYIWGNPECYNVMSEIGRIKWQQSQCRIMDIKSWFSKPRRNQPLSLNKDITWQRRASLPFHPYLSQRRGDFSISFSNVYIFPFFTSDAQKYILFWITKTNLENWKIVLTTVKK